MIIQSKLFILNSEANFGRNISGGPHALLTLSTLNLVKYFPTGSTTGLLEFYSSFINITKIFPIIDDVCEDYIKQFGCIDTIQKSSIIL